MAWAARGADAERQIFWAAFAVVGAGFLQILLQWPVLAWMGVRLRPRLSWSDPAVREVLAALGPTVVGLGVVQVNVLVDSLIAYVLSLRGCEGANTYLHLGDRLMQLPLGVFGIAVATT